MMPPAVVRAATLWAVAGDDARYTDREVRELVRALALGALAPPKPPPLPLFQPGLRWLGTEWQTFRCDRLRCSMPVKDCLDRRARVYPSGGSAGGRGGPRGRPVHHECQGCPVGEANARAVLGYIPRLSTRPPEVLPLSQRMARRARQLVGLEDGEPVQVDPLRLASSLTKDDEGMDYTP